MRVLCQVIGREDMLEEIGRVSVDIHKRISKVNSVCEDGGNAARPPIRHYVTNSFVMTSIQDDICRWFSSIFCGLVVANSCVILSGDLVKSR